MLNRTLICFALIWSSAYCIQNSCDEQSSVETRNLKYEITKLCSRNGLNVYRVNDTFESPICASKTCLRKCCPLDSEVVNKTCTLSERNFTDDLIFLTKSTTDFHIVHGFLQCKERILLNPAIDPESVFSISDNGGLKFSYVELPITNYCVDYFDEPTLSSLVCFKTEDVNYYTGRV